MGSYFIYRLIRHYDVRTYVIILDLIVAVIWFWHSIDYFIKRKITDKQRADYWVSKDRKKGFLYFIILNGILKWAIPFSFLGWIADSRNKFHPISTGLLFLIVSSFIGLYMARLEWNSNKQKAKVAGLINKN